MLEIWKPNKLLDTCFHLFMSAQGIVIMSMSSIYQFLYFFIWHKIHENYTFALNKENMSIYKNENKSLTGVECKKDGLISSGALRNLSSGMFKITHEVTGYRKEMLTYDWFSYCFCIWILKLYFRVYQDKLFRYTFLLVSPLENVEAVIKKRFHHDLSILEIFDIFKFSYWKYLIQREKDKILLMWF